MHDVMLDVKLRHGKIHKKDKTLIQNLGKEKKTMDAKPILKEFPVKQ